MSITVLSTPATPCSERSEASGAVAEMSRRYRGPGDRSRTRTYRPRRGRGETPCHPPCSGRDRVTRPYCDNGTSGRSAALRAWSGSRAGRNQVSQALTRRRVANSLSPPVSQGTTCTGITRGPGPVPCDETVPVGRVDPGQCAGEASQLRRRRAALMVAMAARRCFSGN